MTTPIPRSKCQRSAGRLGREPVCPDRGRLPRRFGGRFRSVRGRGAPRCSTWAKCSPTGRRKRASAWLSVRSSVGSSPCSGRDARTSGGSSTAGSVIFRPSGARAARGAARRLRWRASLGRGRAFGASLRALSLSPLAGARSRERLAQILIDPVPAPEVTLLGLRRPTPAQVSDLPICATQIRRWSWITLDARSPGPAPIRPRCYLRRLFPQPASSSHTRAARERRRELRSPSLRAPFPAPSPDLSALHPRPPGAGADPAGPAWTISGAELTGASPAWTVSGAGLTGAGPAWTVSGAGLTGAGPAWTVSGAELTGAGPAWTVSGAELTGAGPAWTVSGAERPPPATCSSQFRCRP
jgi:hypothetical protein